MSKYTSITFSGGAWPKRGDYTATTIHSTMMRVTQCTTTTLTVRYVYGWAWAERFLAAWEDWVVWPIADAVDWVRAHVRVRP